jgi:hypothetical protein
VEAEGVEFELQKPGQKECDVTEKLYARGIEEWWPKSAASRWQALWWLTSHSGKNGAKEEEASAIDFFYRGEERGERTTFPRIGDDTPAANRPGGDVAR